MKRFLSAPVIVAVVISLGLVGVAVASNFSTSPKNTAVTDTPKLKAVLADNQIVDSDNDNLADWEETLWNTDANNPDTDGDGTKDGEEVKIGRNPLVKGPKDSLAETLEKKEPVNTPKEEAQKIDLLSRDLLQKYLTAKKEGRSLTVEDVTEIADGLVGAIEETPRTHTSVPSDFVYHPSTPASMRTYGNAVGELFVAYFPKDFGQEGIVVERALREQNEGRLASLTQNIKAYQTISAGLKKISVPENALITHTELVNSLDSFITTITGLSEVFRDPLQSLQALKNWQDGVTRIADVLNELSYYFENNNIVFNRSEFGSTFDSGVE